MRRAAVTHIDLFDVDFNTRSIRVLEKGGNRHEYKISNDGLEAIRKYAELERGEDDGRWQSSALFLAAGATSQGNGRLNVKAINTVWNQVCGEAGVTGKTPHSARHAMGKYLVEKTGNIAAVQRQLGHKNAAYSMQYARITGEELSRALNER